LPDEYAIEQIERDDQFVQGVREGVHLVAGSGRRRATMVPAVMGDGPGSQASANKDSSACLESKQNGKPRLNTIARPLARWPAWFVDLRPVTRGIEGNGRFLSSVVLAVNPAVASRCQDCPNHSSDRIGCSPTWAGESKTAKETGHTATSFCGLRLPSRRNGPPVGATQR
jgi:hypothetical protein